MAVQFKLELPDEVAKEATAKGLLTSEAISALLREELRKRRVDDLFAAADRLASVQGVPLTAEEVEAEIAAARRERRR